MDFDKQQRASNLDCFRTLLRTKIARKGMIMKNQPIPLSNPSHHLAYYLFVLALLAIFFFASILSVAANQKEHHHNSNQFGNIAPAVTAVSPSANSIGVPINTKMITAAFTKPMDHNSLTPASFVLSCRGNKPIPGTVAYLTAGNVAILTLSAATELPERTQCTATIISEVWNTSAENVNHVLRSGDPFNIRVRDTTGTSLMDNYSWTFTTGVKPDNVLPRTALVIPIASISMPPAATKSTVGVSEQVISMPTNTAITAVFTTDPAPLENTSVLDTYPATAALEVCPSSTINAVFSVPSGLRMNPLTVSATTFTLTGPAPAITPIVAASVILDSATGNIATFTPLIALVGGATYTARITGYANGVNDMAIPANKMDSDYAWSFTTAPSSTKCFTPVAIKRGLSGASASTFRAWVNVISSKHKI
jgi:hypothetical protein